jgi:hypothetical protein
LVRRLIWKEPSLEDLLADEIMDAIMRSAKLTRDELRHLIAEIARRASHNAPKDADGRSVAATTETAIRR